MKARTEWHVYALGVMLYFALTFCSRYFSDRGGLPFMVALIVAGATYLCAVHEFVATPAFSRRVVVFGLVTSALWQVEFLRLSPGPDDDVHRYVWDGRLQRLGYNPYLVIPSDPAVAGLHTSETRRLNNPNLPSPYPPGAQLFFRGITAIRESVLAFKTAFVICDLAIALVLLDLLRTTGRSAHLVLVYAWNPLLAIEVAGSGHIDIVGALLLVISVAALARRWRAIAALTLGLAIVIKFLPIVLLPLYWKRVRLRDAALATAVLGLLYVPFLDHGRIPFGSLSAYVWGFRFNGPIFALLHRIVPAPLLAALAVLVGLLIAAWLRRRILAVKDAGLNESNDTMSPWSNSVSDVVRAISWPMAVSLLFAPVVFPWYLLWLLPFLTSRSTLPIIIWTVSIIPTYVMWHVRAQTGAWGTLPSWIMPLEYGCVAITAAILVLRWSPTTPHSNHDQYGRGT